MYKIGLKLWSTNENYIQPALKLYNQNIYDYIELFSVPDSFLRCIEYWKDLNIPYIIHGPHFNVGLNFAKKENYNQNMKLVAETLKYADALKAEKIIFHPGISGTIEETARQLNQIQDVRILIENKPYYAPPEDFVCRGYSLEEIYFLQKECGIGFCLDFGHAICAANAKSVDQLQYIKAFLTLNPKMYHLTDGNYTGIYDEHLHLRRGSFPIDRILRLLPKDAIITLETDKDSKDNLDDFIQDVTEFKNILD